ncbi:protein shisa-8 [Trichomycterus rosablanca]|uniref:protein shisa-8 n=1 Tax=Trichomycterus rosablanca TaxID=2290929 RepID=UPI002F35FAA3
MKFKLIFLWTVLTLVTSAGAFSSSESANQTEAAVAVAVTEAEDGRGGRCWGYYDVMGQWDPPFNCNVGVYQFCCGSCYYRFCCQFKGHSLEQTSCSNYDTPAWAKTGKPSSDHEANDANDANANTNTFVPERDQTHMIAYVICGVVALMMLGGIFAKLGIEKSREGTGDVDTNGPRTLTDLLKQPAEPGGGGVARGAGHHPIGSNGISGRTMRTSNEENQLNNCTQPSASHPHNNLNYTKYSSLKPTGDTTSRDYYKSYPIVDYSHHQSSPATFQPISFHPKEKPFLPPPDIHVPLAITVTPSPLPKAKISKTNTNPLTSSSAFKAWDPSKSPVQHHVPFMAHPLPQPLPHPLPAPVLSQPNSRSQAYSSKHQFSIEPPELFSQPIGYRQSPLILPKHKNLHTNSRTEVTV